MSFYGWSSDPETDRELQKKYGDSVHRPCVQNIRKYRVMIRNIAEVLKIHLPVSVLADCVRVDGGATCPKCELPYRDHPEVTSTFHLGCEQVVKT